MKELAFGFLIILSFGNCNSSSNAIQEPFDYRQTYEYEVPESEIAFILPKEYLKITVSEYYEIINNSDLSDELKEYRNNAIYKLAKYYPNSDLLIDTTTLVNSISILRTGPHINLNKELAKLAVQNFIKNRPTHSEYILEESLLEDQYVSKKRYKYLKIKIKQTKTTGYIYMTHYMISTNTSSLGISFFNTEDIDFQEYINRLRVLE